MNQRQLGTSDLYVSEIGFGCMSLEPGNSSNSGLIRRAFDAGINFFDTADRYDDGLNEEIVGQAVKEFCSEISWVQKLATRKPKGMVVVVISPPAGGSAEAERRRGVYIHSEISR